MANVIPEESGNEAPVSNACDYSSAALFNGWGWNPITRQSCAPLPAAADPVASTCDYSNANLYNGWGWDPVARASCPPVEDPDPHADFPICSATLFDADGDGFGWENQASCIVTSASTPPPVFTNTETGNQVDLVRAYWDGNTDLANKVIQCDLFYYDSYNNQYQKEPVPFRAGASLNNQVFPSYRFHHLALPPDAPYQGWIAKVEYVNGSNITPTVFGAVPNWTTDDGRYIGPTVLQSPYIEKITRNNGSRGIRTWHNRRFDTALNLQFSGNRVQNDGYFECFDISGRDLEPTGRIGGGTSSPAVLSNLTFSTERGTLPEDPSTIISARTGDLIPGLKKAYWNYNADLAGKSVECSDYLYDPSLFPSGEFFPLGGLTNHHFPYHFTNSGNRLYYSESQLRNHNSSFLLENGVLQNPDDDLYFTNLLFASDYVQVVGNATRFWINSSEYTECDGIKPTGTAPVVVDRNQCDYSNATQFNGWGWNPVTRQSCAPVTQPVPSNCDYSNAAVFNGWGWNPVTRQSCPPR